MHAYVIEVATKKGFTVFSKYIVSNIRFFVSLFAKRKETVKEFESILVSHFFEFRIGFLFIT